MKKTLIYRLFGVGSLPKESLPQLEREGILLEDEGIRGEVIYRNFRAPGRRYFWKRVWFSGSLALTEARICTFMNSQAVISLPWEDPRLEHLDCSLEFSPKNERILCIQFDAAKLNPDWAGKIEVRYFTPVAQMCLAAIAQKIALKKVTTQKAVLLDIEAIEAAQLR